MNVLLLVVNAPVNRMSSVDVAIRAEWGIIIFPIVDLAAVRRQRLATRILVRGSSRSFYSIRRFSSTRFKAMKIFVPIITGECICPTNVIGEKCNMCKPNTYGLDPNIGCPECQCNYYGVENGNLQCDQQTGLCE